MHKRTRPTEMLRKPDPHRVRPLPRFMHKRFKELCLEMESYFANQAITWFKAIDHDETDTSRNNYAFWSALLMGIGVIRKLGTDDGDHTSDT